MNVRELIYNLEIEKQQLENENKLLRKENNELKRINKKLVDDWNSILPHDTDNENDESVVVDVQESIQTTETSNEESIEEEPKQKKSSRKKKIDVEETPVDEVVSLM